VATLIIFVLTLSIAGGIIAYVGDKLGTHVGKKRISKLGLRPRHTAMLYTILSGVAIALLTLAVLMWRFDYVRNAVLHGRELLATNKKLTLENRRLQQGIARELLQADDAAEKAQAAIQQAIASHKELTRAQQDLTRFQQVLRKRQNELALAQSQLSSVRTNLQSTTANLHAAEVNVAEKNREVIAVKHNIVAAELRVTELAGQEKALLKRNQLLSAQNVQLESDNKKLTTQNQALVSNKIIYRNKQELGRLRIDALQPETQIKQLISGFLDGLSNDAQSKGATVGGNGRAVLVEPPIENLEGSLSEDDDLDSLVAKISQQAEFYPKVFVIATSHGNAVMGEQVGILLQPVNDVFVYPDNSLIVSDVIDGSQPEDIILGELKLFLEYRVLPVAKHKGVQPTIDPETGVESIGEKLDTETVRALIKQIQAIGSNVQITAYTDGKIYTSGPLRIRLTATPATSKTSQDAGKGHL
jgi:hypothetical protein